MYGSYCVWQLVLVTSHHYYTMHVGGQLNGLH